MIYYVFNNLFEEEADYLMEQKNCFHIHGGLSGEMARRYPKAAEADKKTAKGDSSKLGTYEIVDCGDIKVINAYGQYFIGGGDENSSTDYQAWVKILDTLVPTLQKGSVVKIPFLMGCGLGGGDWNDMEDILIEYFGFNINSDLKICIRNADAIKGRLAKESYEAFFKECKLDLI